MLRMADKGFISLDVTYSGQRIYHVRCYIWRTKDISCQMLHIANKGCILLAVTYGGQRIYLVRFYIWGTKDLSC